MGEAGIALVVILILGVPLAAAIWLIVRAIQAGNRIEEISRRLGFLEAELFRLKKEHDDAREPAPTKTPAVFEKISEPAAKIVEPPISAEPQVPPTTVP